MSSSVTSATSKRQSIISVQPDENPVPITVDNLRTVHSRQGSIFIYINKHNWEYFFVYYKASSSSCTSSVGNLGSPKPEKRQANSPLPPTPKNLNHLSNSNLTSTSSIPSGRNSVASVIECHVSRENISGAELLSVQKSATLGSSTTRLVVDKGAAEEDVSKKKNPSKNLEGMYAKVNV